MEKKVRKFNPLDPVGFFSPGPAKQFMEAVERQIKDELDAGTTYRAMADQARQLGRTDMASTLMEIASQEDGHYHKLQTMLISLNQTGGS